MICACITDATKAPHKSRLRVAVPSLSLPCHKWQSQHGCDLPSTNFPPIAGEKGDIFYIFPYENDRIKPMNLIQ